jgi:ribosomal protein S18 acetylase RimI-like enzyme
MYILPAHRDKGLGRLLLTQAELWLQQQGMTSVVLAVHKTNPQAIGIYKKSGFMEN